MATKTLIEKIEALPPERQAEVESFVDLLVERSGEEPGRLPPGLLARIDARREHLLREHGPFDTLPLIRELRENGD